MNDRIFHLAEPVVWAKSGDEYRAASLDTEGFIHCSTRDQLSRTARQIYGDRNDLVLLTIDATALDDQVVYEDLYDSGEDFPHIYGPLPANAVLATGPFLNHLEEGLWLDTRFDRAWMDKILHPDFTEVGMSGRRYDRQQSLEASHVGMEVELPLADYDIDLIDEDVALVRYVCDAKLSGARHRSERTSLWINTNEGWRLRFHQGTSLAQA